MSQIQKILHEHLKVKKKLCCRWIPYELTSEHKRTRVDWCKKMLLKYDYGRSNATYDIVTGDETWIYGYMPERKQQSSVLVFEDDSKPTKLRQARSVGKKKLLRFFFLQDEFCLQDPT
ncbi:Mariner Mos1 transposase [Eumeta japonica]|uniref:Mariner Mos1 transposase n=1 Tax=Eumeta variegata TaxID=151549 RepID=A0A4C1VSF0_EUMVA|nr:Mariner Mos1 transposase [Eumeta japonica]